MIKQSLAFDDILEKKFKILRTSIMLGNLRNREETLSEYEDTAREIDKIKTRVYEELLGGKIYTTVSLEDEEIRLKELIAFIENRVKERNDFVDDYIKITSNFLDGLDKISLENELNSYKIRYNNIQDYLRNCEEIKKIELKLKELKNDLEEKYENKASNELINSKLEDELIDEFNRFISRNSYYSDLNYTDLDLELSKLEESLLEKKNVLDTFNSSYQALISAGISGAEREEYSSYVMDAKLSYYEDIEKKCILKIYKLVLDKNIDYDKLYDKRNNIDAILNDRDKFRESLNIKKNRDELEYFVSLSKEQFSIIRAQKFNIENIDKLILEISNYEIKLEKLVSDNKRSEIVDLLNEFSVENLEIDKIELPEEKHYYDEIIETISDKPFNMVINIKEPIKIDVNKASDTAKLVMKKVVMVLEPKKFSGRKEKIKEEIELEEKIENNNDIEEDIKDVIGVEENIVEESDNVSDNIFDDNITNIEITNDNIDEELFVEDIFQDNIMLDDNVVNEEEPLLEEIDNKVEDMHDVFLDDDPDEIVNEIGTEIDVNNLFEEEKEEIFDIEVKDNVEIKEVANSADDFVSSKVFFEQPSIRKETDLFKSTDPFLDDNDLELGNNNKNNEFGSFVPNFGSIGTVKPNNALSKIEDVVKENNDVVLPNLGLVDGTKTDIPIVSENYIN